MVYNITRSCIQFILPMVIVLAVYASIYLRIKHRPVHQNGQFYRPRGNVSPLRSGLTSSTYLEQVHNSSIPLQGPFNVTSDNNNVINRRWNVLEGRRRRANIMIISIAVVFFLSWLPLNSINLALEFSPDLFGNDNVKEGQSRDVHTIGK